MLFINMIMWSIDNRSEYIIYRCSGIYRYWYLQILLVLVGANKILVLISQLVFQNKNPVCFTVWLTLAYILTSTKILIQCVLMSFSISFAEGEMKTLYQHGQENNLHSAPGWSSLLLVSLIPSGLSQQVSFTRALLAQCLHSAVSWQWTWRVTP